MSDDSGAVVLIVDSDLFFTVKIADSLKHAGYTGVTVRRMGDVAASVAAHRPAAALLNTAARGLDWREALAALRGSGVPVIAYGAHVDVETQDQARQAGAAIVVANSKLAGDVPGLVARALRRQREDTSPRQADG